MAQPRSRFPAYPPDLPEGLQLFLEAVRKELEGIGSQGEATIRVEESDVAVAIGANTLDFAGGDFVLTQSPVGEVNISLEPNIARTNVANVFTASQDILHASNPFVRIGADVSNNVFLRWVNASTFGDVQTQIGGVASGNLFLQRLGGVVIVGIDPSGSEILRIGGAIRARVGSDTHAATFGRSGGANNPALDLTFVDASARSVIAANSIAGVPQLMFQTASIDRMLLTATALQPAAAGGLTLGAVSLPWLSLTFGDATVRGICVAGVTEAALGAQFGCSTHDVVTFFTLGTTRTKLTSTAFSPWLAASQTLGTASLPWSDAYIGAFLVVGTPGAGGLEPVIRLQHDNKTWGTNSGGFIEWLDDTTRAGWLGFGGGFDGHFYINGQRTGTQLRLRVENVEKLRLSPTLVETFTDFQIGSLGQFDSSDTSAENDLLTYHNNGSNTKWRSQQIQFTFGNSDIKNTISGDNTTQTYIFNDPGTGGALPTPNTPVLQLYPAHKSITVAAFANSSGDPYIKTSNFRYFRYEWSLNNFSTTAGSINATSDKFVHGRLTAGTTYYYRAVAVGRDGDETTSAIVSTVPVDSETTAFGVILAAEIGVVSLSAINATIGDITAGQIRNQANDAGLFIDTWPGGSAPPAGWTRYLNLNGSGTMLKHDKLELKYDGTATFTGVVDINQNVDLGNGFIAHLVLRDPDVAHGMTGIAPTSVFGALRIFAGNTGGLVMDAFSETSEALDIIARGTGEFTTKSSVAAATIVMVASKASGTGETALAANGNIIAFRNNTTTRFILDGDGDSHQDVGTAWTNFDEYDDIALLTQLSVQVAREYDPIRDQLSEWLETNRASLEELKLVTFNENGHHFVNMSRLTMLLVGAVRQLGQRIELQERRLALLKA